MFSMFSSGPSPANGLKKQLLFGKTSNSVQSEDIFAFRLD